MLFNVFLASLNVFIRYLLLRNRPHITPPCITTVQVEAAVLSVTAKAKAKLQKKAAARAVSVSEEAMDTVSGGGGQRVCVTMLPDNLLCLGAHAQARYTVVCLCVCVCVDRYSCSRMNQVQVRVSIGF